MSECKFCGSLKAPLGFDICAWCIKNIEDSKNFVDSMPVPRYFLDEEEEVQEDFNIPVMD